MKSNILRYATLLTSLSLLSSCGKVVSPNSKENSIEGLLASYSVDCGSKFENEISKVTSLSGDLTFNYYLDEGLTQKYYDMKFDGLLGSLNGGASSDYWVQAVAGGGSTGYQEVKQVAKITASCVASETPNIPTDCISYKQTACEYCKNNLGEGVLMEDSDIVLYKLENEQPVFNYGITSATLIKQEVSTEPFKVGDYRFACSDDGVKTNIVVLPRINFVAYHDQDIVIKFRTNNRTDWGNPKYCVTFGTDEEASNLFDGTKEPSWPENAVSALMLNYSSETEVLKIRSLGNEQKEVEINDAEIASGAKNITLNAKGASRSIAFFENCIELRHTHDWYENPVSSRELIGYKVRQCKICKESEPSDEIMTTEDINFYGPNAYGADAQIKVSATQEGNRGLAGGIMWSNDTDGSADMHVSFPKVNYTLFDNVVFEFGTNSDTWGGSQVRLSINETNDLLNISNAKYVYGAIEVSYNKEHAKLDVTSRTSNGVVKSVVITDTDVINGTKSIEGTFNLGMYRNFYLNKIELNHTEHVLQNLRGSLSSIGYKVGLCEVCLAEEVSNVPMTSSDVQFTDASSYGANAASTIHSSLEGNNNLQGGIYWVNNTESSQDVAVSFPKVNYSIFDNVLFEFRTNVDTWGGSQVRLSINSTNDLLDLSGSKYPYGVIEFKYDSSEDKLNVTSRTSNGVVKSIVVTDTDVINGTKSLSGTFNLGMYRCFYLNKVELNHNEHIVGETVASNEVIGYKVGICSECLEEVETTTPMTNSDIDMSNGYGVNAEAIEGDTIKLRPYDGVKYVVSDGSNGVGWLVMPRINFNAFTSVRVTMINLTLWGRIGFDADHTIGGFGDGSATSYVYLDFAKSGDDITVTLSYPTTGASINTTLTDEDVINGTSSFRLYHSQGAYSSFCIQGVTVE